MDDLISIIVPVYNVEAYLPKCLDSILGQQVSRWQLLLIDDGSSDRSGAICDEYAAKDKRISVVHTPNGGVSAARNRGLDMASGKWVVFVDSDDYLDPCHLRALLDNSADADIVISGWVEDSNVRRFADTALERGGYIDVFEQNAFIKITSKLMRRELIEGCRLRFDAKVKWGEDSIFFVRVLLEASRVRMISDVSYHYVSREGSAVGRLFDVENEMAGFNALNSMMARMLDVCGTDAKRYFSPYLFLTRTLEAVKHLPVSTSEKLKLLRPITFTRAHLYKDISSPKELFYVWLLKNRHWRLLLDL